MPKKKARQVKLAVPEDDLALSKDDKNTKGSKEDRIEALEVFGSDFAIQAKSLRKQLIKQLEENFTSNVIRKFDSIVKQFPKEVLSMPYEEFLVLHNSGHTSDENKTADEPMDIQVNENSTTEELREKKRAMLMAKMDSMIQEKLPREPVQMITPANVPSKRYNQVSMSTKGRKVRKGEQLILTVMSQRGSPISLDARSFKEAMSLHNVLTPFITGSRAVPHLK